MQPFACWQGTAQLVGVERGFEKTTIGSVIRPQPIPIPLLANRSLQVAEFRFEKQMER